MGYQEGRAAIETHFLTGWGNTTSVRWANQTFDPTPGTPFVRFDIMSSGSWRSMGADDPLYREIGSVILQIHTPINTGAGQAFTMADTAADIFRDKQIDPGITFDPPLPPYSIGERGQWHVVILEIPFRRDEVISPA